MKNDRMSLGKWALLTAVVLFLLYIVLQYVIYSPRDAGIAQAKLKDALFPYKPWVSMLCVHIASSSAAFLAGAVQFLRKPVGRQASLHRKLGYVYVAGVTAGGISGAYLSYYATGGPAAGFGFLALDLGWLLTTAVAMKHVFQRRLSLHRKWMLRSYAFTFAFVTFRVLLLPLKVLAQLPLESAMAASSWLCWIVNLALIEWWIRRRSVMR